MLIYEAYFRSLAINSLEDAGNVYFSPQLIEACKTTLFITILDQLMKDFIKKLFREGIHILVEGINSQYNSYEIKTIIYLSAFLVIFFLLFFILWRSTATRMVRKVHIKIMLYR